MDSYIEVPNYIYSLKEMNSSHLNGFFVEKNNSASVFTLDKLRKIYKDNKMLFFDVRDELILRGFIFHNDKPTNILPTVKKLQNPLIIVEKSRTSKYKTIDFMKHGIPSFTTRFKVSDDSFFNCVPIKNFAHLNGSINLKELQNDFVSAGFNVERANIVRDRVEEGSNDYTLEEGHEGDTTPPSPAKLKITIVYDSGYYYSFRKYCQINNLITMGEIKPSDFEHYRNIKGVGVTKVKKVKALYDEVMNGHVLIAGEEDTHDDIEAPLISFNPLITEPYMIDEYFQEKQYNQFLSFTQELGLKDLRGLKKKHLYQFSGLKMIGKKKVQVVKERIEELDQKLNNPELIIFKTGPLGEFFQSYTVNECLRILGKNERVRIDTKLADLENQNVKTFPNSVDRQILFNLSLQLRNYETPAKITSEAAKALTERQMFILEKKVKDAWTLEDVGNRVELTRERVRQILKKIFEVTEERLQKNKLNEIIFILLGEKDYYTKEDLTAIFGDQMSFFKMICQNDRILCYEENYELYFVSKDKRDHFVASIEKQLDNLPEIVMKDDLYALIFNPYMENGDISPTDILEKNHYNDYGACYSKYKLTAKDVAELMFQHDFKGPVRMKEESFKSIRVLAREKYQFELSDSFRSFLGRVNESELTILVGRQTFQLLDTDQYNKEMLADCREYMENVFKSRTEMNISELYKAFQTKLQKTIISTDEHLYSIMKYYYGEDFVFGKGNTLNIYKSEENKITEGERLRRFILNQEKGITTKNAIMETLKWTKTKVEALTYQNEDILSWGTNKYRATGDWLDDQYISELTTLTYQLLKKGYTTMMQIYEETVFSDTLSVFIEKEGIDHYDKLSSIVKFIMPELDIRQLLIFSDNSQYDSIEDILIKQHCWPITRKELNKFFDKLGYVSITANMAINDMILNHRLVEIDMGLYMPVDHVEVSETVMKQLAQYVEEKMGDQQYLVLKNLEGYTSQLPPIDWPWTPYLINSLITSHGYRSLKELHGDYRYDRLVITPNDSLYEKQEELIYDVLKDDYKGGRHESEVAGYLMDNGLINKTTTSKLPRSLTRGSGLITLDSIGMVILKGEG